MITEPSPGQLTAINQKKSLKFRDKVRDALT